VNSSDLYRKGELTAALEAALSEVKQKPTDVPSRMFLAELCCFAGDFDRAEKHLDTLSHQTTEAAVLVSLFRQLLRGEVARQQVFLEGRTPEIVTPLTECMSKSLEVLTALRDGNKTGAAAMVGYIDGAMPAASGTCDGKPFEGMRDLDDRTAAFLEVITSTGKYYWTPWESVEYLHFDPPHRAMDLLYRRTKISITGGPEGEVFIPTRYVSQDPKASIDDALRLARATDWIGEEYGVVQGVGLRTLLVGDQDLSILEIKEIDFKIDESTETSDPE
jgi:type VI secretion system protein ImpE